MSEINFQPAIIRNPRSMNTKTPAKAPYSNASKAPPPPDFAADGDRKRFRVIVEDFRPSAERQQGSNDCAIGANCPVGYVKCAVEAVHKLLRMLAESANCENSYGKDHGDSQYACETLSMLKPKFLEDGHF